jgi:hypothetical protein
MAMSQGRITKFQLTFSKADQKMTETGLDGATRNSQTNSSVTKDKKFVVLCESGKEAVESPSGSVSPEERALPLRECSTTNGLLSAFEVLNATRIAKDSRTISLDQASALLGGTSLKGKISSVLSFEGENSDGTHSFRLAINEDGGDPNSGMWHGSIVQSQDNNHIETNAEGTNKAIQGLGKSKLESVSTTKLICAHDFKLNTK